MKKLIVSLVAALLVSVSAFAADQTSDKVLDRVNAAGTVLQEIMAAPDKGIPEEILSSADCVAIVPSLKNGGFVVGARYGRGIATCRNNGSWSAPAPFVVEGGSWGLQIGGQAIDLVMLVMNQHGMTQLLNSKFKVGADASAAAGPVGRHAEGSTDWKLRSEILTYSRARGAFAGITLNGAVVKQDDDSTRELYGRVIPFKQLLTGNVPAPASTQSFLTNVAKYFHAARTDQNASATRVNSNTSATTPTTGGAAGTASASPATSGSTPSASGSASADTGTPATSGSMSTNAGAAQSSTAAPATSTSPSSSTSSTPQTTSTTTTTTTTTTTPASSSTPSSADTGATSPSSSSSTSDTASPTTASSSGTGSSSTAGSSSTGSSSTQTGVNPSQLSNSDVKDLIQRALRNEPSLSSSNVNVVVTQDAVQLTGSVATQADKDTVRRIAEQNAGSRKVSDTDLSVK